MKKQLSPIEQAIDAWLLEKHVKFSVSGGTATKRDGWECDAWTYQLWRPSAEERNGKTLEDSYYTGIGHRKSKVPMPPDIKRLAPRILARVWWEEANIKPVAPHAAGILHSLMLDASGAEQNFHDWCSDFGYDSDSIKHQNVYNACCQILTKVRMFFTAAERAELQVLLEDY